MTLSKNQSVVDFVLVAVTDEYGYSSGIVISANMLFVLVETAIWKHSQINSNQIYKINAENNVKSNYLMLYFLVL